MLTTSTLNDRIKKLTLLDLKLAQGIGIFAALIIAKLIPEIMNVPIGWFIALMILCTLRPLYVLFFKK